MAGTNFESETDFDPQDQAEAFDEDAAFGGEEMRTFEELPEVEDLTQLDGDRDDDEALALDADEFDEDAIDDADTEEDHELDYHAADEEHEDDLDGLGPESSFNEARIASGEVDGLSIVRDGDLAEGGEDDTTDYASKSLDDDDLKDLGYAKD